ncbi:Kinesin-like protein kif27 [Dinochytrium kinnereticum]|nr:Kinesin-like protein kif27 [Dinochytrium kinnereticum]
MDKSSSKTDLAVDKPAKVDKGALLPSTLAEGWLERLTKFYLIPEGPFLQNWDRLMVLFTVISCTLLTFMAAFNHHSTAAFFVSYVIDFLFLLDIYIKFHVAYLQGGFWVVFPKEMAMHYLHSVEFKYDVTANLPLDIIALGWVHRGEEEALMMLTFLRIAKIIRVARILTFFRRQERKLHATFLLQVLKFMTTLIVITHTIACIWYVMVCPERDSGMCRMPSRDEIEVVRNQTLPSLYVQSVYWTVTTMTTCGYGDITPQNDGQRLFAIFTMTSGIFFYGYVSGTIASALANMDSRRVSYQQKMDAVRQYMSDRAMDVDMQERVLDYYDYVWERNRGIDIKNLFEDMPSTFRSEVALSLNNAIIDKATIFRGCSIGFRRMIAIDMKLYLFTANEYVAHRGDLGTEMYFITQGRIDVYSTEDLRKPTASLIEGAHFGEFQIILGHRHEYSARAVCNTDIYVLHIRDLERAFDFYPEDRELVRSATEARYKQAMSTRKTRKVSADDMDEDFGMGPSAQRVSQIPAVAQKNRRSSLAMAAFGGRDKALLGMSNTDMNKSAVKESDLEEEPSSFRKSLRAPGIKPSASDAAVVSIGSRGRDGASSVELGISEVRIAVSDSTGNVAEQRVSGSSRNKPAGLEKQSSDVVLAAEEGILKDSTE